MANLKEIRTRIASVKSTRQITSAMKMVSAAKLRRAQDRIVNLRPYTNKLNDIISTLSASVSLDDNPYAEDRKPEKVLVLLITSNRGLCGGFNMNVIKQAIHLANNEYKDQYEKSNLNFFAIGKKAHDYLKARPEYRIVGEENDLLDDLAFDNSIPVAERLMKLFVNHKYDRIDLIYNQFKNAAVQILTHDQFLPIAKPEQKEEQGFAHDFIFEPTKQQIMKSIIPKALKLQFYKSLLDSNASEHGARMTAMHQATENASELIHDLTLQYNKARQASITNEILEIVSGAEALKNG